MPDEILTTAERAELARLDAARTQGGCKHLATTTTEYFMWCWDCGAVKRVRRPGDKFGEDDYQWHSCDLCRLSEGRGEDA